MQILVYFDKFWPTWYLVFMSRYIYRELERETYHSVHVHWTHVLICTLGAHVLICGHVDRVELSFWFLPWFFFRYLLQVSSVTSDRVILDPAGATAVALDSSCCTAMLAAGYGPGVILSRRHKRFFGQVRLLCQVHLGSESSVSSLACWGRTLWALSVELIQFGNSIKWIFHYKTSILGYLPLWNPPNDVI